MGCSASSLDTLIAKAIEDQSPLSTSNSSNNSSNNNNNSSNNNNNNSSSIMLVPKTKSLYAPLVHHPAVQKGDTHHLVCLTSSTYGSLVVSDYNIINNSNNNVDVDVDVDGNVNVNDNHFCCVENDVINTWELMEGLEDQESVANDVKNDVFGDDLLLKSSKLVGFSGGDSKVCSSSECDFDDGQKMSKLGLDLSDSYVFVEMPGEIVEEKEVGLKLKHSSKPLWKHLSEESLLSKMDPNVCNAYERALLGKKLGGSQSGKVSRSTGSSPSLFVSKSNSMGSTPPAVSKMASDGYGCGVHECKEKSSKIVLYFTSLRGIRKTYEDCASVRMILRGFRVVVDERDISMDSSYRKELQSALAGKAMSLPQLFINGKHIGGADDVKLLHEMGELEKILQGFPTMKCGFVCESCGDARFVPCPNCNGSRKIFQEEEGQTRRCPNCNENGLVRCVGCCS